MHIGFTGTRRGMTCPQATRILDIYSELVFKQNGVFPEALDLHHGDCVGADLEMHLMIRSNHRNSRIIGHPPILDDYRAFCDFDITDEPLPYLTRNEKIIDSTQLLIAAPNSKSANIRSGTWYTVQKARDRIFHYNDYKLVIVYPDGSTNANSG